MHIPTVRVTSQKRVKGSDAQETVTEDRSRGFGFVQFLCPRDAARVVKVIQRVVVFSFVPPCLPSFGGFLLAYVHLHIGFFFGLYGKGGHAVGVGGIAPMPFPVCYMSLVLF